MAERAPLPSWAVKLLVWGSSVMGSCLVGVVVWIAGGIGTKADAVGIRAEANEKRIERLELVLPYQFKEIKDKLDAIIAAQDKL